MHAGADGLRSELLRFISSLFPLPIDEDGFGAGQPPTLSQAPPLGKRGSRIRGRVNDPLDSIREALGVLQASLSRGPSGALRGGAGGIGAASASQAAASQLPMGYSGTSAGGATQSSVLLATQNTGSMSAAGGGGGGSDRQSGLHATISHLQVRE